MRLAAITDIHGNLPALEAVLADIRRHGVDLVVQLGDTLSGPLWPAETADALIALGAPGVRGNHDRMLLGDRAGMGAGDVFARERLDDHHLRWLAGLPFQHRLADGTMLFHATPQADDVYLLEDPATGYAQLRPAPWIEHRLQGLAAPLMICGHSHVARVLSLEDGRIVVNAGSVGLQAYTDDDGGFHRHEAGSPHARYALVDTGEDRIDVAIVAVDYDWAAASRQAAANGRPDWATWLASGRS